jgi:hypothetical protein
MEDDIDREPIVLRERKKKKLPSSESSKGSKRGGVGSSSPSSTPSSPLSIILKVLGLFSLAPLVFSIPFILSSAGRMVKGNEQVFIFIWIFYGLVLCFIIFRWRRHTVTFNSFTTQMMTWGIFSLGAYVLLDLPRYLAIEIRQVALYLWCTFTMFFNLIVFFYDDTNYQEEERKEKLKEERRKKKEEERKAREKEDEEERVKLKVSGPWKVVIDMFIYISFAIFLWWAFHKGYAWYEDFQMRIAMERGTYTEPEPNFDYN